MSPTHARCLLGAVLLAVGSLWQVAAHGAAASSGDSPWEVLVPAGRFGRFSLSVERARFAGTVAQVAARLGQVWAADPWPVIGDDAAGGHALSRLTPAGIETISLRDSGTGRVDARRSLLEWRARSASSPGSRATSGLRVMPEPAFVGALQVLGEPLSSFASLDGPVANLTRTWLANGDVAAVSHQVERAAGRSGLSPLLRFDAPGDAPIALRGGRVLAFGGGGVVAVVTFNAHHAGTAVVVHCQERLP